jgi:hypothetical protein
VACCWLRTHMVDVDGVGISLLSASVGCFIATGDLIVLLIWIWGAEPSYRRRSECYRHRSSASQTCHEARATLENMVTNNAFNGKKGGKGRLMHFLY